MVTVLQTTDMRYGISQPSTIPYDCPIFHHIPHDTLTVSRTFVMYVHRRPYSIWPSSNPLTLHDNFGSASEKSTVWRWAFSCLSGERLAAVGRFPRNGGETNWCARGQVLANSDETLAKGSTVLANSDETSWGQKVRVPACGGETG
jgi:hypothetical protein